MHILLCFYDRMSSDTDLSLLHELWQTLCDFKFPQFNLGRSISFSLHMLNVFLANLIVALACFAVPLFLLLNTAGHLAALVDSDQYFPVALAQLDELFCLVHFPTLLDLNPFLG
ncbi:hypothetical protein ES705_49520 [subsurface metagenome]